MAEQQNTPTPAHPGPARQRRPFLLALGLLLALGYIYFAPFAHALISMRAGSAGGAGLGDLLFRAVAIAWAAVPGFFIGVAGGGTGAQVRRRGIIATAITAGLPLLIFLLIV